MFASHAGRGQNGSGYFFDGQSMAAVHDELVHGHQATGMIALLGARYPGNPGTAAPFIPFYGNESYLSQVLVKDHNGPC